MDCLGDILRYCKEAVESVDEGSVEVMADAIVNCKKTFIYGSGRSGLVGQLFAVRLVQLGYDVHFIGEMTTPIIRAEDLTVLISNTGKTSSVVQTARIARRIGSKVVAITGNRDSELAKESDVQVVFKIPHDVGTERTAPLGSIFEDSAHLLFECVVCEIMEREGITEADMRNRHAIWV